MGLLDKFKREKQLAGIQHQREVRHEAAQQGQVFEVNLVEREWDKPDDPGDNDVWGRGFALRDDKGLNIYEDDRDLSDLGVTITKVAGVQYRANELSMDSFTPGRAVALVREKDNEYDANAVAVYDADRANMVGYLPKDVAARVAPQMDAGTELNAVSLWEWVKKPSEERVGLKVFIAPTTLPISPRQ